MIDCDNKAINLENIQILGGLIDIFTQTERNGYVVGLDRKENDSEHTYSLTMICWYMALDYNRHGGKLDINKVIQYSLVHDMVEIYAGDTDTYSGPKNMALSKHDREMQSLQKLQSSLSFFPECTDLIIQYETQEDEESKFVKAIDKSVFPLAQMRDEYRSWKTIHVGLSLEDIDREKQKKINHPIGLELWLMIKKTLEDRGGFYWRV